MKKLLGFLVALAAGSAMASAVGDSYEKVISDNGAPRSQLQAGSMRIMVYATSTIKLRDDVVVSVSGTPPPSHYTAPASKAAASGEAGPTDPQLAAMAPADRINALITRKQRAIDGVNAIVNQPVVSLPLTQEMQAQVFGPGWFHPGAITPDFDHVDVTQTQETNYAKYEYVRSDICPGVAFRGADLEFNSMTKYFYQDRSLPKKRLTMDEMLEINRLYRIIGASTSQLAALGVR